MKPNPKTAAREQALLRIAKFAPAWIATASAQVTAQALNLPAVRDAKRIGCFLATPREVQTPGLLEALHAAGKALFVPAWNTTGCAYQFSGWQPGDALLKGPHGAPEPAWPRWTETASLDLIFVPLVSFDRHLRRLGHGGGNFDRLLAGHNGVKIGLAFEAQRITAVPVEEHDVTLDAVVTEARVYDTGTPWAATIEVPAELIAQRGSP